MKEHKKIKRIITRIAFLVYIIVLLFLVFGADRMEQSRKGNIHGTSWNGKGNRTTDVNCDGIGPLIRCGILSRCL